VQLKLKLNYARGVELQYLGGEQAMKNGVFWGINPSSYFTGDSLRLRYRAQPDNAT
jgi:hypothetical protein